MKLFELLKNNEYFWRSFAKENKFLQNHFSQYEKAYFGKI